MALKLFIILQVYNDSFCFFVKFLTKLTYHSLCQIPFIVSFSGTLITWTKNGVSLIADSTYRFDPTRKRLTIISPSKKQEGQYSCAISGSQAGASGQLRVIG